MQFSVHVFLSVFSWLFFFARRDEKVRAQFKWANQNTWSVTTKKKNLKISHAPLIFLQAFMKQYYGMP